MGLGEEKKKLGIGPAYDDDGRWIRGTKLRVEKKGELAGPVPISIDGEPWTFKRFYTVEVIPEGVEYMFNGATYFKKHRVFTD